MKTLLLLLLAVVTVTAAPSEIISREDLRKTVEHIQQLAREAEAAADKAREETGAVRKELAASKGDTRAALERADVLQTAVNAQRDWGIEQQKLRFEAEEAKARLEKENAQLTKENHTLKLILCSLVAAVAVLVCLTLKLPLIPGWGLWVTIGAPIAAFALAWVIL